MPGVSTNRIAAWATGELEQQKRENGEKKVEHSTLLFLGRNRSFLREQFKFPDMQPKTYFPRNLIEHEAKVVSRRDDSASASNFARSARIPSKELA